MAGYVTKEKYDKLCQPGNKPLAIMLLHGRDSPEEKLDDWGYGGGFLFIDWIHITYLTHISVGFDGEETGPGDTDLIYFTNDLLAVDNGEKVAYYGDWEIIPAKEALDALCEAERSH